MTEAAESETLLETARRLCTDPPASLEGKWQRAAAFLTRQALELALDGYWQTRAPGVSECRAQRAKLLCLPEFLRDHEVAHDAHQTWVVLSGACHQHAYALDPAATELLGWISRVERLRNALVAEAET